MTVRSTNTAASAASPASSASPGTLEPVESARDVAAQQEAAPADTGAMLPAHAAAESRRASVALIVLATLATLYALHVAKALIVPVVMAAVIAYLLDPLVSVLERHHIPRSVGATLALLGAIAVVLCGVYLFQGQVESIVDRLPGVATKLSRSIGELMSGDDSMLQKIRRAATVLNGSMQAHPARGAQVVVERPADGINSAMLSGSLGIFEVIGQVAVVLFLTFFLLVSGDIFKRKLVKVVGPTIREKKMSVHMLDEINRSVQRYIVMLVITNAALGLCTWGLLTFLEVENAGMWALVAAVLHVVPYFGALLTAVCLAVVVFMQFGALGVAATAAGGSLLIATLIGSGVTTWMTGRMARMNPVAVFLSLLLFTWLWGAAGMLLAIPLAVIAKVVADHVDGLEVLAEFLGE